MKLRYQGLLALFMLPAAQASVFINEIHYDNVSGDVGEAIEVAGTAGTDLSGYSLVLYNGSNGSAYGTINLSGTLTDQSGGYGTLSFAGPASGIQNGAPDGVALVDNNGTLIQFLSYEGSMTGVGGVADGITSIDIGVAETTSTPIGASLQLIGSGTEYSDFAWVYSEDDSFGAVNDGQIFGGGSTGGGDTGGGDTGGETGGDVISGSVCTGCPDLTKFKDISTFNAADYYAPVQLEIDLSSSPEIIKAAINNVISSDIKSLTYAEVWTALTYTDEDAANTDNVILWYTARSQAKASNGSGAASSNPDNWNREHSWPKSHGFPDESQLAHTDIHHLRPTDISVNSSRGNLDFDNSDSVLPESPINKYDGDSFEPRNEVKGDVARMMFYMDTRYEGAGSDNTPDLALVNRLTTSGEPNLGYLCTLIAWSNADPVDANEQRRNDRIYEVQGNRNPFIDNPNWIATLYPSESCASTGGGTGGGDTGGETGGGDTGGGDTGGETPSTGTSSLVFINEIHYDDASTDAGEGVEIAGPAGTDLSGMTLVPYNGSNGQTYSITDLSGTIPNQQNGFGTVFFAISGLQNGAPDGVALVAADGTTVLQFLSYEGSFAATNGPASGMTSEDIGVNEPGTTPDGYSMQLAGSGFKYADFTWQAAAQNTYDAVNTGQTFVAPLPFINEIHYDDASTDAGEGVEIAGLAGLDLSGMSLVPYNGSNGQTYSITPLSGTIPNQQNGFGTVFFPISGLQNGAPDGVALVAADATVIQFLSYEGSFVATNGPALGMSSVDIGVAETGSTLDGDSLQLGGSGFEYADFSWQEVMASTYDAVNTNQSFGAANGGDTGGTTALGQCADPATLISAVQGNNDVSPVVGQTVVVEAVVSATFPAIGGFFMQEEAADMDADAQTSEGLFVAYTGAMPAVGSVVRVVGDVSENFAKTQMTAAAAPLDCGTDTVDAVSFSLPFADANAAEAFEGMLVTAAQALTVSDNYNLAQFGEVTLSFGRLYNPTNLFPAGSAEAQAVAAQNSLNAVILDDGANGSNPADIIYPTGGLSAANTLRGGDTVSALTGVMDFSFGNYRVIPTSAPTFAATNARTAQPDLTMGNVKVASMNVLNYFTTLDLPGVSPDPRGADSVEEFNRQRVKMLAAMVALDADILGLMEIENNGVGAGSALNDVVSGLNDILGAGTYASIDTGVRVGTDQITTAFIYQPAKVTPINAALINNDSIFNRPPIAQTFALVSNGETLTVVVNHFKSKGCGSDGGADADNGDGQSCYNGRRVQQANALTAWLATDAYLSQQSRQLIIGDLNAYAKEDPILALQAAGFTNLIEHFQGAEAYSYSFGGTVGYLDHALASADLLAVAVDANDWHINADEPRVLDYNVENKSAEQLVTFFAPDQFRMSDHDPVVMSFQLDTQAVRGDWDGDGDVDINDIRALTLAIQKRLPIDMAFDLNNDGVVNALDTRVMKTLCTRTSCAA
jgi:uncharacterized protein